MADSFACVAVTPLVAVLGALTRGGSGSCAQAAAGIARAAITPKHAAVLARGRTLGMLRLSTRAAACLSAAGRVWTPVRRVRPAAGERQIGPRSAGLGAAMPPDHFASMRPKRQTASASTQVRTNRPTIA